MDADDPTYWGLFENRPAKERTTSILSEPSQNRGVGGEQERAGKQRAPRAGANAERIKC